MGGGPQVPAALKLRTLFALSGEGGYRGRGRGRSSYPLSHHSSYLRESQTQHRVLG